MRPILPSRQWSRRLEEAWFHKLQINHERTTSYADTTHDDDKTAAHATLDRGQGQEPPRCDLEASRRLTLIESSPNRADKHPAPMKVPTKEKPTRKTTMKSCEELLEGRHAPSPQDKSLRQQQLIVVANGAHNLVMNSDDITILCPWPQPSEWPPASP
jgi:phage/plasmid-associated DNA primase